MSGGERVFVGLGSNLDDPAGQVRAALGRLSEGPDPRLLACSALYASPPMGPPDQPDYINAVAAVETDRAPRDLLAWLQGVEADHARRRGERWGPRTLDLDILLWGQRRIDEPGLCIPHPGLPERAFVLYPLAEIAPDLELPGGESLQALLAACPRSGLRRLDHDHAADAVNRHE